MSSEPCAIHKGVIDGITLEPTCEVCGHRQIEWRLRQVGIDASGLALVAPEAIATPGEWVFEDMAAEDK